MTMRIRRKKAGYCVIGELAATAPKASQLGKKKPICVKTKSDAKRIAKAFNALGVAKYQIVRPNGNRNETLSKVEDALRDIGEDV